MPSDWLVHDGPESLRATNSFHRRPVEVKGPTERVVLSVPLSGTWIDIPFTLPATPSTAVLRWSHRRRRRRHACGAGDRRRGRRARVRCPRSPTARPPRPWTGIPSGSPTTPGSPRPSVTPLAPSLTTVPDALVGLCWPAVFATIGAAVTEAGVPVVEGLLSLVHLDHAAHLLGHYPPNRPNWRSPQRLRRRLTPTWAVSSRSR